MKGDAEARIRELEDELRLARTLLAAERERVQEARQEVADQSSLITRAAEYVTDSHALIDAFDLQLDDDGKNYKITPPHLIDRFDALAKDYNDLWKHYSDLRDKWNDIVPRWNAVVAPRKKRAVGRPLAASDAQCRKVLKLAEAGKSLRHHGRDEPRHADH